MAIPAERSWYCTHGILRQQAYDILPVPAMSAECERIFSSSKRLINLYRMSLSNDIIEASECLKPWWVRNSAIDVDPPSPAQEAYRTAYLARCFPRFAGLLSQGRSDEDNEFEDKDSLIWGSGGGALKVSATTPSKSGCRLRFRGVRSSLNGL